ncbi:RNA polymerase sigma factor, partial [Nocardia gipuzkoensis]
MVGRTGSEPRSSEGPARELRVLSGDRYADWEAVYRDNVSWVYGLMFTKVGNRPDAEDLTAEVFMTALKPLRVSASVPEVRAYLRATARTVLAGYWRTR